jgi:hypothetical protein
MCTGPIGSRFSAVPNSPFIAYSGRGINPGKTPGYAFLALRAAENHAKHILSKSNQHPFRDIHFQGPNAFFVLTQAKAWYLFSAAHSARRGQVGRGSVRAGSPAAITSPRRVRGAFARQISLVFTDSSTVTSCWRLLSGLRRRRYPGSPYRQKTLLNLAPFEGKPLLLYASAASRCAKIDAIDLSISAH